MGVTLPSDIGKLLSASATCPFSGDDRNEDDLLHVVSDGVMGERDKTDGEECGEA